MNDLSKGPSNRKCRERERERDKIMLYRSILFEIKHFWPFPSFSFTFPYHFDRNGQKCLISKRIDTIDHISKSSIFDRFDRSINRFRNQAFPNNLVENSKEIGSKMRGKNWFQVQFLLKIRTFEQSNCLNRTQQLVREPPAPVDPL